MRYPEASSFLISHIFPTEFNIQQGNQTRLSFEYNEKQVTELYTVDLPIYKNVYLIQMKALKTTRIHSVMVHQLPFLSVICIKQAA